jgi:DNA-binding IclR family transcriptional regulator
MRVKQIANLFSLMDFFVRSQKPLTMREIVEEFGWPRSSAFNIVTTLVELGYLYQPTARGGFSPTSKWSELAKDLANSQPLPESVHELLVDIMLKTGETVILAGGEGTMVVFLDIVESTAVIKFTGSIGERTPIHITSLGKAILSQHTSSERMALLRKVNFEGYPDSKLNSAEAVERDILKSARQGWFVNVADEEGLLGIGVPFPFKNRRNAIAIGAPTSRAKKRVAELGTILRDSVQEFLDNYND